MTAHDRIISIADEVHRRLWRQGKRVSSQTKRSTRVCKIWQALVEDLVGTRAKGEVPISKNSKNQRIDLVDIHSRTAYELKASKNNVHMEIYRDVFKVLVFNLRRDDMPRLRRLVFIAPAEGLNALGDDFIRDVRTILKSHKLRLELAPIRQR